MSLERVIFTKGTAAGITMYPVIAAANASYPFCVYETSGNYPNHTKTAKSQLDITTVVFTVFAKTFQACKTAAALVRSTFDNISGSQSYANGTATEYYNIDFFRWDDESDSGFDYETEAFTRTLIFKVGHNIGN